VEYEPLAVLEPSLAAAEPPPALEQAERQPALNRELLDRVVGTHHERWRMSAVHLAERRVHGMPTRHDRRDEDSGLPTLAHGGGDDLGGGS
jgi:hypothetical protein